MNKPNFSKLEKLHNLCQQLSISWELHYGEGEDNFYFCTHSPAKEENYMTKDMRYDLALDDVIEFLEALKGDE